MHKCAWTHADPTETHMQPLPLCATPPIYICLLLQSFALYKHDKRLLFSPLCCLSSRRQRWEDCLAGLHAAWSAKVNCIQKSHTSPTNSRRTHPNEDPAPCSGAEATKALLTCSADCWLQTLSRGEILWPHCPIYLRPLAAGVLQP